MAMRPRTFRRLVLTGILAGVVILGAIGYFVIAPMQERKSIEKLRSTGMAAYQQGDYTTAVQNLRRYLRNVEISSPEELLAFARARVKVQASDGGHLRASVGAYRDYLLLVPDDIEASAELLALFNRAGMWPEARALGESMRSKPGIDLQAVLSEELIARTRLNKDEPAVDPQIAPLFDQLLGIDDRDFSAIWYYTEWLKSSDREDKAIVYLDEAIEKYPEDPGPRVLRALTGNRLLRALLDGPQQVTDLVAVLTSAIGWDAEQYAWKDGTEIGALNLGKVLASAFDQLGRGDLALVVEAKTAAETDDPLVWGSYARRLWWAYQDQKILEIKQDHPEVLGFQVLALERTGNEANPEVEQLTAALRAIDTDFRAKAWVHYLEAKNLLEEGKLIEARGMLAKSVNTNPLEPVFHLTLGDVHSKLGREGDARKEWLTANEAAGLAVWAEPTFRLVVSHQETGHLSEAGAIAQELVMRAPTNPKVRFVWLQSQATMAREGLLDPSQITDALNISRSIAGFLSKEERSMAWVSNSVLLAALGRYEESTAELSAALDSSPSTEVFSRIIEVDQYYDLGVIDQSQVQPEEYALRTPMTALGYAHFLYLETNDRSRGLSIFEKGIESSTPVEKSQWELARAKFLDGISDGQANENWNALIKKYPDDIEILHGALESDALGLDLPFVEDTIAHIMKLTSTKGRAEPTRLRLARARAIAGDEIMTRNEREQALGILRSIIATDAKNITARLMLSNLLDRECSPQIKDEVDRFERDREGAAAEQLAISRLIAGPMAQVYLFRVSQLNVDMGNIESARQNLLEAYARSEGNHASQYEIIRELRRAGEFDLAVPRLIALIDKVSGSDRIDYQIALARMLSGLNQRARMLPVLQEIAGSKSLNRDQLTDLFNLYYRLGNIAEAEQILANAGHYGISETDVLHARLQYAKMTGTLDEAESILHEMIENEPSNTDNWLQLATLMSRENRFDEAHELLKDAIVANPGNEQISYQLALYSGDRSRVVQMVSESTEFVRIEDKIAMERIIEFENALDSLSPEETVEGLFKLARTFPSNIAVQRYAYEELVMRSTEYRRLGIEAESASRRLGTDEGLLEIAAKAYSKAQMWPAVVRVTNAWRAQTTIHPTAPDLFAARASYNLKDYKRAKELLAPYIETARRSTDEAIYRELLFVEALTSIALNEPVSMLAVSLEPIARESESFRNAVWVRLAAGSIPQFDESVRWLQVAFDASEPTGLGVIANAWLQLGDRFPAHASDCNQRAMGVAEQWLSSTPSDPGAQSLVGHALRREARGYSHDDPARTKALIRARDLFDAAAAGDPADLNHLFLAAQCASDLGEDGASIARYRTLMKSPAIGGIFAASIKNNLAGAIERSSSDPKELSEASDLAQQAIEFLEHPSFLGTRGWVEFKRGDRDEAARQFRRAVTLDPDSAEGWAGLAVVFHETDQGESSRAIAQLERLGSSHGLNPSVSARLSSVGIKIRSAFRTP